MVKITHISDNNEVITIGRYEIRPKSEITIMNEEYDTFKDKLTKLAEYRIIRITQLGHDSGVMVDNETIVTSSTGALGVKDGVFSKVGHKHEYASLDHTHPLEAHQHDDLAPIQHEHKDLAPFNHNHDIITVKELILLDNGNQYKLSVQDGELIVTKL